MDKNPNLETTINDRRNRRRLTTPSTSSQDFKNHDKSPDEHEMITTTATTTTTSFFVPAGEGDNKAERKVVEVVEENGRERLKRHRVEMSGQVWIPDIWGQEDLLKNWIDSTVFDSSLENNNIMSAREALIQEGRSTTLSIENSC